MMAVSVVVGAMWENSFAVVGFTSFGDCHERLEQFFKKMSFKVDMCRFAYMTYKKMLIRLTKHEQRLPLEEFDELLIRCKPWMTPSQMSCNPCLTVPYDKRFYHTPIDEQLTCEQDNMKDIMV